MDYLRQENESDFDYIVRLIEGKSNGSYDIDYVELFKLAFNIELSSSEARKRYYGIKMVLPYVDKEKVKNISDEDIFKELELKKQELEKEKIKVQTERITLNQALREQARFELFIEQAVSAIRNTKPIEINTYSNNKVEDINNISGLLLFADPHYGKELCIKGLYGEILNEYSIEIFEKRMWNLLNQTISRVNKEKLNRISIFNLGDELEGIIRVGQLMNLKLGLVDSSIAFSYFLASWLNELSKYVTIDYYSTEGNHTDVRLLDNKKGTFPHENMSKVIQALVCEILKDNPNVIIHKNNTDKIFVNIQGFNVLGIHGEEKCVLQAIRDFSYIYNTQIDFICTGHKHHANSINAGIRKGCIGVGSIIGIDDYSMTLKRTSDPSATFALFEKGVGKIAEYTMYLN